MSNSRITKSFRKQRTLKKSVSLSGIGVHTGHEVRMDFHPAEPGQGIIFRRADLPHRPRVPANVEYVCDTSRSTTIGIGKECIHTVEHVLAALKAYNIDNVTVDVSNIEPPIGDGSSQPFVEMIEKGGVEEQQSDIPIYKFEAPIHWSEGDIHLAILPYDGYRISYTLNYPDSKAIRAQYYSVLVNSENFKREIAPCRTFSLYKEVSYLMDRGLIKGGSLDNAVIIHDDAIFSKNGLHFPDEMARHKILDLIGDLALVGAQFEGHIISIRSGHSSNYQLAKKIFNHIKTEVS